MIGWLVQLVQDAYLTPGKGGSRKDGIAEMVFGHNLRARERKEDATLVYLLKCLLVQTGIALQRIVQGSAMLGKGRRVEDDKVVMMLLVDALQELKCVFAEGFVTRVAREIQLHVLLGQLDGLARAVHAMHQLGATPHGIERETTSIAEHIQDALAVGILFQQRAVLALVDEESCLLAAKPVDTELQTILRSDIVVAAANEESIHVVGSHERQRRLALVVDMRQSVLHYHCKRTGYLLAHQMHTNAMGLHDGCLAIDIDNQSRQVVALAVHQAVGVVLRVVGNADGTTHLKGRTKARLEEDIVNGHIVEGQYPDGDGALLIVAYGDEIARNGHYTNYFTLFYPLVHRLDGTGENPRMEPSEALFLTLAESYLLVHLL